MGHDGSGRRAFLLVALLATAADAVSKGVALHTGAVLVNPGVSFGLLSSRPLLAVAISSAATAGVIGAAWHWAEGRWWGLAWGLVVGGAVGNLGDRWFGSSPAGVVDWIHVPFYPAYFNLADVAIRGGGILILMLALASAAREWRDRPIGFPERDRPLHHDAPAPRAN